MPKTTGDGFLTPQRIRAIKLALLRKREELLEQQKTQLSALHAQDRLHLADLEEISSEAADSDSVCALVDLSSSTVYEIDAALEKIERGTYGICEDCQKPIRPDRLEVLPFASLCIECQREKERRRVFEAGGG